MINITGEKMNLYTQNMENHKNKLIGFLSLQNDWDGDNGHAPQKKHIDAAIELLNTLPKNLINNMNVYCVGDGEIGFDVNVSSNKECNVYLEFGWMGDDTFSAYGYIYTDVKKLGNGNIVPKNKKKEIGFTVQMKDPMPTHFVDFINKHWGDQKNKESNNGNEIQ